MVIAPHPDDETLGCGGTLLRHKEQQDNLFWVILTSIKDCIDQYGEKLIKERFQEIQKISKLYDFKSTEEFNFKPAYLDQIPLADIILKLKQVLDKFEPDTLYIPSWIDSHSDHRVAFNAISSCIKWFRAPYIKKVMAYETLSETDFSVKNSFLPNTYFDISKYIDKKIEIFSLYKSELAAFPFPRSPKALRAQAMYRGTRVGFRAAEAFRVLLMLESDHV